MVIVLSQLRTCTVVRVTSITVPSAPYFGIVIQSPGRSISWAESWTSPVAAVMGLPVAILGAMLGCWVMGVPVSIYTPVSYTHLDVYKRQGCSTMDLVFKR